MIFFDYNEEDTKKTIAERLTSKVFIFYLFNQNESGRGANERISHATFRGEKLEEDQLNLY